MIRLLVLILCFVSTAVIAKDVKLRVRSTWTKEDIVRNLSQEVVISLNKEMTLHYDEATNVYLILYVTDKFDHTGHKHNALMVYGRFFRIIKGLDTPINSITLYATPGIEAKDKKEGDLDDVLEMSAYIFPNNVR